MAEDWLRLPRKAVKTTGRAVETTDKHLVRGELKKVNAAAQVAHRLAIPAGIGHDKAPAIHDQGLNARRYRIGSKTPLVKANGLQIYDIFESTAEIQRLVISRAVSGRTSSSRD